MDGDAGRNSTVPARHAPEFRRRAVREEHRGLVASIVGYRETGFGLSGSVEMAPLVVPLILSFAEPFEIALGRAPSAEDRYGSFTSGLHPGFVTIRSTGGAECIQVDFTPIGAFRFFALPMRAIASRMVTLDELADGDLRDLRLRLAEEPDWERRFDRVEAFLSNRLAHGPKPHAAVAHAYSRILGSGGAVRIGDVARGLDWSRKHLNQRFREEIGLGPKAVARMARFNRVLALAKGDAARDWADIAAACGYADQAHLVREFRDFAGAPPTAVALPARAPVIA
ncbi:helix-turn-helix domain-containing protein [Aquibium microcysteis]|uniref:helix-turn-helix domain-containing protein n=1 Tax=Aquibium microcysteis TaxID=675281 RepID=UPI00165D2440|nr:helix-turn-helix domain-containing protein [Aquibium microcysteis]